MVRVHCEVWSQGEAEGLRDLDTTVDYDPPSPIVSSLLKDVKRLFIDTGYVTVTELTQNLSVYLKSLGP